MVTAGGRSGFASRWGSPGITPRSCHCVPPLPQCPIGRARFGGLVPITRPERRTVMSDTPRSDESPEYSEFSDPTAPSDQPGEHDDSTQQVPTGGDTQQLPTSTEDMPPLASPSDRPAEPENPYAAPAPGATPPPPPPNPYAAPAPGATPPGAVPPAPNPYGSP